MCGTPKHCAKTCRPGSPVSTLFLSQYFAPAGSPAINLGNFGQEPHRDSRPMFIPVTIHQVSNAQGRMFGV